MSDPIPPTGTTDVKEQEHTALFAHLVMQQTNMAMMLMGKTPHPEAGHIPKDLEAAQLFIDQLEMLESKTKGNLNKQEAGMLKQALMSLRMAFVEAVDEPAAEKAKPAEPSATSPSSAQSESEQKTDANAPSESSEDRKKFTKKY